MSPRMLLIEDDPALLSVLQAAIAYGGFEESSVRTGREAIETFARGAFDAVLIDLGLPDMDGEDVLTALRERSSVPILVVSGRNSEPDRIRALDLGADDFVPKPFLPGELLARIRAALRRSNLSQASDVSAPPSERDPIAFGPLTLDPMHRTAAIGGAETAVSDAEYKVLWQLARCSGEIVAKDSLLEILYGAEPPEKTRIVDVYISTLRRKLRALHPEELIFSFRGRGWMLKLPA